MFFSAVAYITWSITICHITASITALLLHTLLHHKQYCYPSYTLLLYTLLSSSRFATAGGNILKRKYTFEYISMYACVCITHTFKRTVYSSHTHYGHLWRFATLLNYTHYYITGVHMTPSCTLWSSRIYITALCITNISHDLPHYSIIHITALYTFLHYCYTYYSIIHIMVIQNIHYCSMHHWHLSWLATLLLYTYSCVTVIHITPSYTLWSSTIHTSLLNKCITNISLDLPHYSIMHITALCTFLRYCYTHYSVIHVMVIYNTHITAQKNTSLTSLAICYRR